MRLNNCPKTVVLPQLLFGCLHQYLKGRIKDWRLVWVAEEILAAAIANLS
jgi:hypothetical protein